MLRRAVVVASFAVLNAPFLSAALAQPSPQEMDGAASSAALRRVDSRFVIDASNQRFELVTWSDAQGRRRVTVQPVGHAPVSSAPEEMDRISTEVAGTSNGLTASTSSFGRWTSLGPDGGQIVAIGVSPTQAQLMLAGAGISQGNGPQVSIYRSTDGGANWAPSLTIGSQAAFERVVRQITFAPDGVAYAAAGRGVYRSRDGGTTWDLLRAGPAMAVAVDPSDPRHLWAGFDSFASPRVMRSSDGGATWTPVDVPAVPQTGCRSIAFDPARPAVVFLGFGEYDKGQVWFSSDDGAHWSNRSISTNCPVVNKLLRHGERLYAAVGEWVGLAYNGGLYVSSDDGANWNNISAWAPSLTTVAEDVAVDPSNPCTLWVANQGGILRSLDCGLTWNIRVTRGSTTHAIVALPGVVFAGSETDGVLRSIPGGLFQSSSRGIRELNVAAVAANPNNPNEMAAAASQLNSGGIFTSTDAGQTWNLEPTVRQRMTTVQFAPDGLLYMIADGPGFPALYRRNANGVWANLGPGTQAEPYSLCFDPAQPRVIVAGGRDFATGEGVIWQSGDGGVIWRRTFNAPSFFVTDVALVGNGQSRALLATGYSFAAGTSPGKFLRSTDDGYTWTDLGAAGIPGPFYPYHLAVSRQNPDRVYMANVSSRFGLFRSEDAGRSWSSTGWDQSSLSHVTVHPDDDQVLYAPGHPALQSRDGGRTFQTLGDGAAPGLFGSRILVIRGDCSRLFLASTGGVQVRDEDVVRPRLSLRADPNELWPPNHDLIEVHASVAAHDDCDEHAQWRLMSITADDGGPVDAADIDGASYGTADDTFRLRASRSGSGPGRTYAVTYEASDESGNTERRTVMITAPHDQSGRAKKSESAEPTEAVAVAQVPRVFANRSGAEVRFGLVRPQHVRVDVYDLAGARIRTLSEGMQPAGAHTLNWDGRDGGGRAMPSGVYLVRVSSADLDFRGKAVLVR